MSGQNALKGKTEENSLVGKGEARPGVLLPIEEALLGRGSASQERLFRGLSLLSPTERLTVFQRFCGICGEIYDDCTC